MLTQLLYLASGAPSEIPPEEPDDLELTMLVDADGNAFVDADGNALVTLA